MITVNSCCCFKLETGGILIVGLQLIGYVICSVMIGIELYHGLLCLAMQSNSVDCLYLGSSSLNAVCVVLLLLCTGFTFIAWLCIKGIETRHHSKVKPMMIVSGIVTLLSPLRLLIINSGIDVVEALVIFFIYGLCFLIIYSLYKIFRREHESGGSNRPDVRYEVAGKV